MSLNKFMHPRNPFFNNPCDFFKLSQKYPDFARYIKCVNNQNFSIDFKDPEALKSLCCTLLNDLYGLNIDIPIDHLIPRVPQRINYVLWIEDLLEKRENVIGIDIGCGTCCIFGLLATALNKNWRMIGSDISNENIEWSKKNIFKNNLQDKINVYKVEGDSILIDLISKIDQNRKDEEFKEIDFVMCNPPFYANESENLGISNTKKPDERSGPSSVNTGRYHESIYDQGGEVSFVKKMIDESISIGKRIKIYTTMFGKKSSLIDIKNYLLNVKNIQNISETTFCQGHTMRWGLAWSFDDTKLKEYDYKKIKEKEISSSKLKVKDNPLKFVIDKNLPEFKNGYTKEIIYGQIREFFLKNLKFEIKKEKSDQFKIIFEIHEKTWFNRKERRERTRLGLAQENAKFEKVFSIQCYIEKISNGLIELRLSLCENRDRSEFDKNKNYLNEIYEFARNFWKKRTTS
ncbi:unnamed protein product [Brachionus calyciflorus]|uniref:U6 small nuclear RNA (adenine-(43)-N(6))-methyltransferase n=1 Tax=Brachionus calyciflorus TaxID=104777 RepID=A0A813URQ3_9BILA|nr:unnamed protein product [Brachionus calyciflorus]